ncbi:FxLYD domain-containing protein [Mesobacillus maritimus]|nr:FxLYD domain-containing protein [Mesobacillus maritimus]MCM3584351.1 FxLYD domain-containing protein [Mesobacillus maritimus]MCM3669231.1 FxLYD domain-containing protein [Mesobacillus maritimus]
MKNSLFCSQCGTKLDHEELISANNQGELAAALETNRKNKVVSLLPLLLPFISLLLVSTGLTFYYVKESNINEETLELKRLADQAALDGNFKEAKKYGSEALEQRPGFMVLETDLEAINDAIQYQQRIKNISNDIKKSHFNRASKELASLKDELTRKHGPIYQPFNEQLQEKNISITVGSIKQELNNLNTIDELANKLTILASLPREAATATREQILNKIVQLSTDKAETELSNKQFSNAFITIDKGLQYAVNDEKLLSLKTRVQQEKEAFELAEQQRIEQALKAAEQEDLKNRTAAVEVTDFIVEVDEYGDIYLKGTVKNTATKGINSITISYTIFDENKEILDKGEVTVYPFELAPGESGTFEDTYFGAYQDVTVEIDNITWYLN